MFEVAARWTSRGARRSGPTPAGAASLSVVHFLVSEGVSPDLLSAAGYGEFDPVARNDAAPGRQSNRRTEIVMQPNIDELIAVPDSP